MLLYRPLIIDWLPAPLPHPPQQTGCLLLHPHLLCLCLLVSLSPPLSPLSRFPPYHVSFSFYLFLCLSSSSVLLHCFRYCGLMWGPHVHTLCCLLNRLCLSVDAKYEGQSLLLTSPAPQLCPAAPALSLANRSLFWCGVFMLCLVT